MRDSNVANAAKESTQRGFSHGLLEFCSATNLDIWNTPTRHWVVIVRITGIFRQIGRPALEFRGAATLCSDWSTYGTYGLNPKPLSSLKVR